MSSTLGEKLREAREERGITISEVAEQTRISSLYLECIENDDYRSLPGGIFSKGFVKSFAKYVGVDEQEALVDYTSIVAANDELADPELKVYRPEVLTDNSSGSSMIPTVIAAVVILALMTGGILFLVNYLRQPAEAPVANKTTVPNTNQSVEAPANTSTATPGTPDMATLKVDVKAVGQPVLITSTSDGIKADNKIAAESTVSFTPTESLILNYNRWNFKAVQLTINGTNIDLPTEPLDRKGQRIEFTINKDNLAQIWTNKKISTEVASVSTDANANVDANTAAPVATAPTTTAPPPQARPTPKPPVTVKPVANTAVNPTQTPKTVIVPSAPPSMTSTKPTANKPN